MNLPTPSIQIDLKAGLIGYCERHKIGPSALGRMLGYQNPGAYGWRILRGAGVVTVDCLGRFVMAYGGQAADELLTLAGMPEKKG